MQTWVFISEIVRHPGSALAAFGSLRERGRNYGDDVPPTDVQAIIETSRLRIVADDKGSG